METKKTSRGPLMPIVVWSLCCFGLLAVGCDPKREPPPSSAPEVLAMTVQAQPVALSTELPGRTSAYLIAEIRPQVGGIVKRRLFEEGSNVTAGDVLYEIDPAPFEATFNNANASLARSEANLPAIRSRAERYADLLKDKAVSQQDHDDAASALKEAEAAVNFWKALVDSASINLKYTRVTAPISGRIGRSEVTDGALVTAHQPSPLATIQQTDPIYVDVPQSTVALLRWKSRMKDGSLEPGETDRREVGLILEDGTPYPSQGTFQFQDITVDPTTGSVLLRAVFPNPQGDLLPGMFVRAVVKAGVKKEAILVPQQSVSRDPKGNPTALIVDSQGKVELRPLEIDRAIGDKWLVSSGLAAGDRVILEGLQKVRPGASVTVVAPEPKKPN